MAYKIIHKTKTFFLLLIQGTLIDTVRRKYAKRKYQKAKKLNKSKVRVCYNGIKINLYLDSKLSEILVFKPFEKEEQSFLSFFLKKGGIFVDIGSNIGLYSLIASKIVGEEGKVYSFEPTPEIFNRLKENIKANRIRNIYPYEIALSNKSGTQPFLISRDGYDAWNSFGKPSEGREFDKILVETTTLDEFIEHSGIEKIDLVKLDVEGWEVNVLHGGIKYFSSSQAAAILVEFTDINQRNAGYSSRELYFSMLKLGYQFFTYNSLNKLLTKESLREEYPYLNLIALKRFHLQKLGIKY